MRLVGIPIVLLLGCAHPALTGSGNAGADRVDSCGVSETCGPLGGHAGPALRFALVGSWVAGTLALAIHRVITHR
jgi:hypothetical protein